MGLLPRFFGAKDVHKLHLRGVLPRLRGGARGLGGGPEASTLEGVFQGDHILLRAEAGLLYAGFELDLNGDVTVGTGAVGNGLLDGETNSAGGAGEGELDRVRGHGWPLAKGFDVALTSDLCGKAFHLEGKEVGRDEVDGFGEEFCQSVHGDFLRAELG